MKRLFIRSDALAVPPVGLPELRDWYANETAAALGEAAWQIAESVLPNLFGYHLLQVGAPFDGQRNLLDLSRVSHRALLETDPAVPGRGGVVVRPDALPIQSNAIDVLVLPHTLEFCANPAGILREAERILVGEGRVLILGFSPWSAMGLGRLALAWRGKAPWAGHFLSAGRVADWLGVLGFVVERIIRRSFLPPIASGNWRKRLSPVDRIGGQLCPVVGNLYGILACKRVIVARPARLLLRRERLRAAIRVAEPSGRGLPSIQDPRPERQARP